LGAGAPDAVVSPEQPGLDQREERLFRSLDFDNDATILPRDFERVLTEIGLDRADVRLHESVTALDDFLAAARLPEE
jgi:hypothetical protein